MKGIPIGVYAFNKNNDLNSKSGIVYINVNYQLKIIISQ